ncbi:MAG: sigma-70 family RNA polymerase sigma factor [Planctomycetaceae bacterium]|nr:sigma-70 family RNA polymerase sigma factor [Planctomycetaceae bacterium]
MQHRTALYGYIFSCVKNHTEAEDILHDVCVIAIESFDQLNNQDSFFPWVREIAFRQVLAHLKKQSREKPFNPHVVAALADAVVQVEETHSRLNFREILMNCLDKLPENSRELILTRYDGTAEDVSDLASRYGKSVHSIYSRLKRIKTVLRNCVAKQVTTEVMSEVTI